MTDKILSPCNLEILQLFEQGDCLTFNVFDDFHNFSLARDLMAGRKGRVISQTARFALQRDKALAFFSDGTLLVQRYTTPEMVESFVAMVQRAGYPVKIKGCDFDWKFMCELNDYARSRAGRDDLVFEPFPSKEKFVESLFADGNICLTAAVGENINPECRKYLALFSDGRFIVSENYYFDRYSIYDYRKVNAFINAHKKYFYRQAEYVPQSYLNAIYQKAHLFDWYAEPQDAVLPVSETRTASLQEIEQRDIFITELLSNGNRCLSVTFPLGVHFAPDIYHYALFSDGQLVIDRKSPQFVVEELEIEIGKNFPELKLTTIQVPSFYIAEIYRRLQKTQKTAAEIYLEILKQKAKKLGKKLNIPHHAGLELVAKMAGWQSWKLACRIDEDQARFACEAEKNKKELAATFHQDPLEMEYQKYLKKSGE